MTNPAFIAIEYPLQFYNGKAIIDLGILFYYDDDDTDVAFDFAQFNSAYLRVYDERQGRLIKSFTLTRSSNALILNLSASDMTFDDLGFYYYELGYNRSGYEIPLMYGKFSMI